jgi:hypothetical protein
MPRSARIGLISQACALPLWIVVLDGHKLLEIDCVDRVYLTLSVPNLVVGGQVVNFLTAHEQIRSPHRRLPDRLPSGGPGQPHARSTTC